MVNPLLSLLELKARHAIHCRRLAGRDKPAQDGAPTTTELRLDDDGTPLDPPSVSLPLSPQEKRGKRRKKRRKKRGKAHTAPPSPEGYLRQHNLASLSPQSSGVQMDPLPLLGSARGAGDVDIDILISPKSAAPSSCYLNQLQVRTNLISMDAIKKKPLAVIGGTAKSSCMTLAEAKLAQPGKMRISDLPPPPILSKPGVIAMIGAGSKGVTLDLMTELLRRDFSPILITMLTGVFQRADVNHNKSLDRAEMLTFMTSLYAETNTPLPSQELLEEEIDIAFSKFDKDDNELLDLVEIVSFMRVCHLSVCLNKKWRPKLSTEELAIERQKIETKKRQWKEESENRKKQRLTRNKKIAEICESISELESSTRGDMELHEEHALRFIACEAGQSSERSEIHDLYHRASFRMFNTYAVANRRALIAGFIRESEVIKKTLVQESLQLVNTALKLALKEGTINDKGVESLFSTVGYKCSLNRLVKDMQDTADDGRQDEINAFLDNFSDGSCEAFSGQRWQIRFDTFGTPREIEALAVRLQEYYEEKYPDNLNMLGELTDNLDAKLVDVVYLASTMYRRHKKTFPNNSPSALLVMCLYTCEAEHIEKLLHLPKDTAPAIYKDINRALREGHKSSNHEAQATLRKWIGFIAVLSTTKVNSHSQYKDRPLYRGLMNLPERILMDYLEKEPGEYIYWPAATSASVEKSLVMQEFTKEGTALVFVMEGWTEGAEMWHVSAYFEEKELLLPPFTVFMVTKIEQDIGVVHLNIRGSLGDRKTDATGYTDEVDRDFGLWLKRVATDKSHEAMATQILAVAALRHEVEKLPEVFLSEYGKLMVDEHNAVNVLINALQKNMLSMFEPSQSMQSHINRMWKHVNSGNMREKILNNEFGVDFTDVIEKAVQSLVG